MPDGSPSFADPRFVLKRALKSASDAGYSFYTHPEVEFYLCKGKPPAGERPVPTDDSGYFDHTAQGGAQDFRREVIAMLETMGISVEFSHHEAGPGQQEIDLRYADALTTADNIMIKAGIFGFCAAIIGGYNGLNAGGGPSGVGRSVNESVIVAFMVLFVLNALISAIYFQVIPQDGL